ncbi:hypothetical protein A3K80_06895 [Candidatus Bathyarchaeota archaeon RBG_13_38_9]|nr:MAG: hypothetical protein A3K80_06895 [Candidatus Bathyarchaeota archaeon RBG_13_38_9]
MKYLLLPILLTVLCLTAFTYQVQAQPPSPKISLRPDVIYVNPCSNFIVELWITDIPAGWMMTEFGLEIDWDPDYMELVQALHADDLDPVEYFQDFYIERGWNGALSGDEEVGFIHTVGWADSETMYWTADSPWLRVEFHCLEAGISPILLKIYEREVGPAIEITDGDAIFDVEPEPFEMDVHQIFPVGGLVSPTNKLAILTPYIALAGLIATISAVYVIKRRKD